MNNLSRILGILSLAALSLPQTAIAQSGDNGRANHLRTLLQTDPTKIEIAEDKRSDLSSCDASEGPALVEALHNCWPLLQGFQKYWNNKKEARAAALEINRKVRENLALLKTPEHEAMKAEVREKIFASAQELYDMVEERKYPLQDMLLFLANLTRVSQSGVTGDYETGLPYLDDNIRIMETTKMTEPGFVTLEPLRKQRERYLQYIKEQADQDSSDISGQQ